MTREELVLGDGLGEPGAVGLGESGNELNESDGFKDTDDIELIASWGELSGEFSSQTIRQKRFTSWSQRSEFTSCNCCLGFGDSLLLFSRRVGRR